MDEFLGEISSINTIWELTHIRQNFPPNFWIAFQCNYFKSTDSRRSLTNGIKRSMRYFITDLIRSWCKAKYHISYKSFCQHNCDFCSFTGILVTNKEPSSIRRWTNLKSIVTCFIFSWHIKFVYMNTASFDVLELSNCVLFSWTPRDQARCSQHKTNIQFSFAYYWCP